MAPSAFNGAVDEDASLPLNANFLMLLAGRFTCLLPQDKQNRALKTELWELRNELLAIIP
jgi:hypothetical protein